MLKLSRVAVTGSIASGKSTVCRLFKELGAYTISADEIVHELLVPDSPLGMNVVELFGKEIVKDGTIDREAIASRVFSDVSLLTRLEKLIHPEVQKVIEARYRQLSNNNPRFALFIAEIPLLYESQTESFFDTVVVVYTDEEVAKTRFKKSRGFNSDEYDRRARRLLPISEKIQNADFVINNSGSLEQLKQDVENIFNQLI